MDVLNIGWWVIGKCMWTYVPRLMKIVALVSSSAISKFGFVITWSMSKILRVSSTSLLCGAPKSWFVMKSSKSRRFRFSVETSCLSVSCVSVCVAVEDDNGVDVVNSVRAGGMGDSVI